jgi:hypothetical protein
VPDVGPRLDRQIDPWADQRMLGSRWWIGLWALFLVVSLFGALTDGHGIAWFNTVFASVQLGQSALHFRAKRRRAEAA